MMVFMGIMRISWQFHGDILETSWEYDWAYHGSHGSRGNRGKHSTAIGSEYPLSDQPVGVTTTTIYGGIPSFKTFLGNCLLLGLPQSVPFITSVFKGFYQILRIIVHPKLLIQLGRIMWGIDGY